MKVDLTIEKSYTDALAALGKSKSKVQTLAIITGRCGDESLRQILLTVAEQIQSIDDLLRWLPQVRSQG